jgi:aspartate/methionine/tyrosine aminotransferase
MEEFSRIQRLPPYVFNITDAMKRAARHSGEDIIDFGMGNPDGATPKHIVDKLVEAVLKPPTHRYSVSRGIPRLRRAICNWYKTRYNVDLNPETEAIVTIGSKEGIAHLCLAILDSRDTVLVPNPSYPIHIYGPVIAGAHVVSVPVHDHDQFLAELENLIPRMTPRPKALIVNFPSNPTTECVDLPFLARLVELAKQYGFHLIHDLAYADLAFDGYKPPSVLEVPGAKDVAVEFFTLSKSYNMPGWRVGFTRPPQELLRLRHLHAHSSGLNPRPRRPARVRCAYLRELSSAPQRAGRWTEQVRLASSLAEGDDVRLGRHPRAIQEARLSGVFQVIADRSQDRRLAGHRLRRLRRRPRPLLAHRKRGTDAAGAARDQASVRQRIRNCGQEREIRGSPAKTFP